MAEVKYTDPTRKVIPGTADDIHHFVELYCKGYHKFEFDPSNPVVRLHEPTIGADEINAAIDVMLSTKVTQGPLVRQFEQTFTRNHHLRFGVACNSGSSANLLIIAALCAKGLLKRGDEVIISALSWSTTAWPLIQHGLIPILVDCDAETFNIRPDDVERAVTDKTRAIMPVHVYGNPCDMDQLTEIRRKHQLLLIEDCCEAMGAKYKGRDVGSFGEAASFSFYLSHHITTLEGGIACAGYFDLAEQMRIMRAHGWIRDCDEKASYTVQHPDFDPRFLFVDAGYNLRMTEVSAAIGLKQLPKLEGYVALRRANNEAYRDELSKYPFFRFQRETDGGKSSCFDLAVVLHNAPFSVGRLCAYLADHHIETRPVICGNLAEQPAMQKYEHRCVGDLSAASNILRNAFSLGNHHFIDANARKYVCGKIDEFVRQNV